MTEPAEPREFWMAFIDGLWDIYVTKDEAEFATSFFGEKVIHVREVTEE